VKRVAISIFIIVIFLFANSAGLVAFWKFDEGSGTVASDSSGSTAKVLDLPAEAWYPDGLSPNTILQNINVAGQGQIATVDPGEQISISYSIQIFAVFALGDIRQAFFGYSWASSWPPWDAYTEIYSGMPGLYPGVTKKGTFNIKVPTTPGEYNVWLLGGVALTMHDAVAAHTSPPTVLPHAKIIVRRPNKLPTAYIDSVSPNPAYKGQTVWFSGHGTDPDGSIVTYEWRSSIDGFLSSSSSFSTSSLSVGTHTIYFRVKDNAGAWSPEATITLKVKPKEPSTISISVNPTSVAIGESINVSGIISPAHESPVELGFRKPDGSTFVSMTQSDNSGSYRWSGPGDMFDQAGIWYVHASWPGDEDHEGAQSSTISFEVVEKQAKLIITFTPAKLRFRHGETAEITVKVTNTGNADATEVMIEYEHMGSIPRERWLSVGSVPAGSTITRTISDLTALYTGSARPDDTESGDPVFTVTTYKDPRGERQIKQTFYIPTYIDVALGELGDYQELNKIPFSPGQVKAIAFRWSRPTTSVRVALEMSWLSTFTVSAYLYKDYQWSKTNTKWSPFSWWIYYGDIQLPEEWGIIVLVIRCDNWIQGDTISVRAP